jgi:hypothetical protein
MNFSRLSVRTPAIGVLLLAGTVLISSAELACGDRLPLMPALGEPIDRGQALDLARSFEEPRSQERYAAATMSNARQNIGHQAGTPGSAIKRA